MSRQAFSRFTASVVAFLTFAGLGACDHKSEQTSHPAASTTGSPSSDLSGQAVTIETGGRSFEIAKKAQTWPEEIPGDVPKLFSGKIRKIIRTETPEGSSWDMAIDGLSVHVLKMYAEALKAAGFETTSMIVPQKDGERGSVTGLKDDVSVVLIASGGNASLSVIQKQ